MTKAELIEKVGGTKGVSLSKSAVERMIDNTFSAISQAIREEKRFSYPGFGTFTLRSRKARTGRNPKTGETIQINASRTVGFRPAPGLKKTL
jgi:DNA-binding protein HU-beta